VHFTVIRDAIVHRRAFAVLLSFALLLAAASTVAAPAAQAASLVGTYDGGQMEIAAALELKADGRFRYVLSYGALDEEATGKWTMSGDHVLLTSDPVTAPRFVLVSHRRGENGMLQLNLDVPKGLSRQYFDAAITMTNGQVQRQQFSENGLSSPFARDNVPTSVRILLQMFDVISEPVALDANSGYSVRFRFEPNDLGKVPFQATPLRIVDEDLVLDGHGRTIRFKHTH
jgi:hypothetical protein